MNKTPPYSIEPFFLEAGGWPVFCLYLAPTGQAPHSGILYLHPFAEEMHKSRRMAARQARMFAEQGCAVLLFDYVGCGDSGGDFGDATWEIWLHCARVAYDWLAGNTRCPISLWGLRLGAALALEFSVRLAGVERLILWQPIINGKTYLNQFLRLKTASEMLSSGAGKTSVEALRMVLSSGQSVEVGGYRVSSDLARAIDTIDIAKSYSDCPIHWFELSTAETDELTPISNKIVSLWKESGMNISTCTVKGENFWTSLEIKECEELLLKTAQLYQNVAS